MLLSLMGSLQKGHLRLRRMALRHSLQMLWSCEQMSRGVLRSRSQWEQQMLQQPREEVLEEQGVNLGEGCMVIILRLQHHQSIYFLRLQLVVMTAHNRKQEPSHSTNHTSNSRPLTPHQHFVSPFSPLEQPSPLRSRMASSPLHVPLAIALRKLVSEEGGSVRGAAQGRELENIKNILQQFAQSLCAQVEREIYGRFNVEMKRMVLKYREAEKLLKKTQEKLTLNADILHLEQVLRQQKKKDQQRIEQLQARNQELSQLLVREGRMLSDLTAERTKLATDNVKLATRLQRLQDAVLRRLQSQCEPRNSLKNRQSLPRTPKPMR